jgi:hypothetical protein
MVEIVFGVFLVLILSVIMCGVLMAVANQGWTCGPMSSGPAGAASSWEYRVVSYEELHAPGADAGSAATHDVPLFQKRLCDLGAEGWELVHMESSTEPPGGFATFKRRTAVRPQHGSGSCFGG